MKSNYKRITLALITFTLMAILLTSPATAQTSTYELNASSGVWTSVVGGGETVTGEGSNEIHWGVGIWPDYKKRACGLMAWVHRLLMRVIYSSWEPLPI
jgi:hypothetical protein